MSQSLIRWDRSVFHNAETPDRSCPELIDLTGLARHVVFGPFVTLEAGLWRATVDLELCPDAARRHLVVEFGGSGDFSGVELPPRVAGRKSVSIDHRFHEGTQAEVRVLLAKAAFHGDLRFLGATLERLN